MTTIEAIYEKGVFRPTEKVEVEEGQKVKITLEIMEVKKVLREKDSADDFSDIAIETGIPDLATNIDYYLYSLPKQSEQ